MLSSSLMWRWQYIIIAIMYRLHRGDDVNGSCSCVPSITFTNSSGVFIKIKINILFGHRLYSLSCCASLLPRFLLFLIFRCELVTAHSFIECRLCGVANFVNCVAWHKVCSTMQKYEPTHIERREKWCVCVYATAKMWTKTNEYGRVVHTDITHGAGMLCSDRRNKKRRQQPSYT